MAGHTLIIFRLDQTPFLLGSKLESYGSRPEYIKRSRCSWFRERGLVGQAVGQRLIFIWMCRRLREWSGLGQISLLATAKVPWSTGYLFGPDLVKQEANYLTEGTAETRRTGSEGCGFES